jgi:8-oxo-dGTP pyrophosphatase MutT (NUDIX family)
MHTLYDLQALRPLSLFAPDIRLQQVTVDAEPRQISALGQGHGREAEVIFVLRRSPDEVLLINKNVYPENTFRLPTGGVEQGETPLAAAIREIHEETGYRVTDPGLLGVVDYTLHWPELGGARFVSYVFMADTPPDHTPVPADGEIDGFRWVQTRELSHVASHLRSLPQDWVYWGRFRAVSYDFIQSAIMQYNDIKL